jgi:hypothetical protein
MNMTMTLNPNGIGHGTTNLNPQPGNYTQRAEHGAIRTYIHMWQGSTYACKTWVSIRYITPNHICKSIYMCVCVCLHA